ncbi:MAG: NAD(P)-binding domain-containing protein [Ignavibacteriaceae bacterium]|nr:NAD(P)-binding domain-containing protein [Ignavibacteriaceae bacterium]
MNIGILGTGMVSQAISPKLIELGHNVMIGTRNVEATLSNTSPNQYGMPPFSEWYKNQKNVALGTFADTASFGEMLMNCTSGGASLDVLKLCGAQNLNGKILIDISNPLDFSKGFPPSLSVCNTDSLGEQIQRTFPALKVVKALNTLNASVMINPSLLPGDHNLFICGNDEAAKSTVVNLLKELGWKEKNILDMGDITNARATEMLLPIWVRLYGKLQTPLFNFNIVKAQ